MLANLGQYSEALVAYDQAISQSRQNFILDFELADILEKLGRDQEALNIYNKGMGLYSPNFPLIYNKRGIFYAKHVEWSLALQDYNQAIKLDLNFAEAYFNRAVAYYQLQQPDLAMNSYNQAVKLDAKFAEVTYNQAPTFYKPNIWD